MTSETFSTRTTEVDLPQVFASLRLTGADLRPDELTAFIGTAPTGAYEKGEIFRVGSRQKEQRRAFGLWLYTSRKAVDGRRVEDHLDAIARLLLTRGEFRGEPATLHDVVAKTGFELLVSVFWHGAAGAAAPAIDPAFIAQVEGIGGTVETDFESAGSDDADRAA